MTTRAPAKERFRERHVVLVSPTFITPAGKSDPNSVQVNREHKLSAIVAIRSLIAFYAIPEACC